MATFKDRSLGRAQAFARKGPAYVHQTCANQGSWFGPAKARAEPQLFSHGWLMHGWFRQTARANQRPSRLQIDCSNGADRSPPSSPRAPRPAPPLSLLLLHGDRWTCLVVSCHCLFTTGRESVTESRRLPYQIPACMASDMPIRHAYRRRSSVTRHRLWTPAHIMVSPWHLVSSAPCTCTAVLYKMA